MTVRVFRSTDTNAPQMMGQAGMLIGLLDACLVNGYGSTRATQTITIGSAVSNNDTITIDGTTYTWKSSLTPAVNEILIGTAAQCLSNLAAALNDTGTRNTNYGTGSQQQINVYVSSLTSTVLTLSAMKGGTAGNSIAISKSAANITLGGSTLTGGTGSDTTTGAGWTKPYAGSLANTAMYYQGAGAGGNRFYLNVLDNAPGAGLATEARISGFEQVTSATAGTFQFPTITQASTNLFARKSVSGAPQTARSWVVVADEKTFYCFISAEGSTQYQCFAFGDFYSYLSGDGYRCGIWARGVENTSSVTTTQEGLPVWQTTSLSAQVGSYLVRGYTALGGSDTSSKVGDTAMAGGSNYGLGVCPFPNPVDGALYLSRSYVHGCTSSPVNQRRGYMRGFYQFLHSVSNVADGDTFTGAAGTEFDGKTFLVVKTCGTAGVCIVEISDTWDTSS